MACGGGLGKIGTEYEQLIAKLMTVEGDNSASFWKDPMALYTKEPLTRSLTTLPSEDLQKKALDLFKVSAEEIVFFCLRSVFQRSLAICAISDVMYFLFLFH